MEQSGNFNRALQHAAMLAQTRRSEFICPEHLLMGIARQQQFRMAFVDMCGGDLEWLCESLEDYIDRMERVPDDAAYSLASSEQFNEMMKQAFMQAESAAVERLDVPHILHAMLTLPDSMAADTLREAVGCTDAELLSALLMSYEMEEAEGLEEEGDGRKAESEAWRQFVVCMNDHVKEHNPLIGREEELERTIQVLCRKDKNNPLHVGESGVGKTALVWGLVARLEEGRVPKRLKGCRVYGLDLGGVLAGAQYRGEFEKRIKMIMDGIAAEGHGMVYIDEIHNLVGAGQTGEGAMDAMQMLRPYMEDDGIRFIGSTTYAEKNRYMNRAQGMMRRFQQIDIQEPSEEDAVLILKGLQARYEEYHHVKYEEGMMEYAVKASARHMRDRFLPDKALDLIDEAGACVEMRRGRKVKRADVDAVLMKVCKINAEALKEQSGKALRTLASRIREQIYGQDEAVGHVVTSVEMAKAGLLDEDKPLASLLFVGPTGVGKTEVARVLAQELGIELVRFDMSEYTEKHTVAKLIGSPAGYVGYEDGGLLTDAIRKNPNCVLLLDEIEKAHEDIYNILLQVMDYARLTDNRGNKADFRNVILIMTSNAGAQYASQASIGFGEGVSSGEAMMKQVRKTFKPEFLNRLSGTVVFHDMDRGMATLILDKKLRQLEGKLANKDVTLDLSTAAHNWLLDKGFTRQYGAREMDRAIRAHLSTLLMQEILYGKLQKGGKARIDLKDGSLVMI